MLLLQSPEVHKPLTHPVGHDVPVPVYLCADPPGVGQEFFGRALAGLLENPLRRKVEMKIMILFLAKDLYFQPNT